ncbi:MAG TPA: hypothetical protein VHO70_06895 [Chitinispirillaceae bacterium]|nr:hypothetical protein [Chitinispirillaceae bacterium]
MMFNNVSFSLQAIKKGPLLLIVFIAIAGHLIAYKLVHVPAQIEMVVLFAAVFFYPVLRHPQFGIILLFSILPFIPYLRRLYYLQYARPSADPLIIIGDLLVFFIMAGLFFEIKDKINESRSRINYILICYVLYMLFRTFVLNIAPASDAILKFRLYGPSVFLFFTGSMFAFKRALIIKVLYITIFIGIIAALYGFHQIFFGYSRSEEIWFSSISFTTLFIQGLARPFSIFQSPASFADYMQLSIISLMILFYYIESRHIKILFYLLVPFYFYATLITSVRSNWLGIIVSLFLWIFFVLLKNKWVRITILSVIIIIYSFTQFIDVDNNNGVILTNSIFHNAFNQQQLDMLITNRANALTNPFQEHSLLSRISLWKFIFDLSFDPFMALAGRGIGTLNADSLYFTYLAELGYPGFFFIIGLTIIFISRGLSLAERSSGKVRALAQGITIMNITFAVINLTGTHIHSFPGDAFYWFFNGILIRQEFMARNHIEPELNENSDNH